MSLLRDFVELISAQPGALVYHLVTLFAIQLIVGVAVGHWERERSEPATRLLVTGIGLFAARVALMAVAVLHSLGLVSSAILLPPLERFLHLITSLLVIWSFLPWLVDRPRMAGAALVVITLAAATAYAAFALLWPAAEAGGALYNSYWQARVWDLSTALVLGMALSASLIWRGPDWGWLLCLLGLWLAGNALQLTSPSADSHYPGWVRLANLAALPLLAGLMYRRALRAAASRGRDDDPQPSGAWGVLDSVRRIRTGSDLKAGLQIAATSVSRALNADVTAIGLLHGDTPAELRVVGLHPTTQAIRSGKSLTLPLANYPVLARAAGASPGQLDTISDEPPRVVNRLYRHLGFEQSGSLLVQPLIANSQILGLILSGYLSSEREWPSSSGEMLEAIAMALAPAIADRTEKSVESDE